MSLERYETNPFLEGMLVPIKGKQVRLSLFGKDNDILVNQCTGDVRATHVVTYKQVDNDQFIKLFTANIALTFNLSSAGIKTFNVLLWTVQKNAISKDEVDLDNITLNNFIKEHHYKKPPIVFSMATFKRGITELEKAQIIAKTLRKGRYFINPNFVFNGDRVAFTTLIQRKIKTQENQLELFNQQQPITNTEIDE